MGPSECPEDWPANLRDSGGHTVRMEPVCVCGHVDDEHLEWEACTRCVNPPCRFFVLRFWRETVNIGRNWEIADPVGCYWRMFAPAGSTAWCFSQMALEDRAEVASDCFRDAQFDRDGEIACLHGQLQARKFTRCVEEYLCEVLAAMILMPDQVFQQDLMTQARRHDVGAAGRDPRAADAGRG